MTASKVLGVSEICSGAPVCRSPPFVSCLKTVDKDKHTASSHMTRQLFAGVKEFSLIFTILKRERERGSVLGLHACILSLLSPAAKSVYVM